MRCGSNRLPPTHPPVSTRRCLPVFGRFLCPPAPKPLSVATGRYHSCFGTAPSDGTASSNPLSSSGESPANLSFRRIKTSRELDQGKQPHRLTLGSGGIERAAVAAGL